MIIIVCNLLNVYQHSFSKMHFLFNFFLFYFPVRSLASVALRKAENMAFHFNYFSVDLNEVRTTFSRYYIRKVKENTDALLEELLKIFLLLFLLLQCFSQFTQQPSLGAQSIRKKWGLFSIEIVEGKKIMYCLIYKPNQFINKNENSTDHTNQSNPYNAADTNLYKLVSPASPLFFGKKITACRNPP